MSQTFRDKRIPTRAVERLCQRTVVRRGCWEYEPPRGGSPWRGYWYLCWREEGKLRSGRTSVLAARIWKLKGAEIKEGYEVHHECGNSLCHNPDHLVVMSETAHKNLHHAQRCEAKELREHAREIATEMERRGVTFGGIVTTDNERGDTR